MARSIQLPPGIADLVKATGKPTQITGVEMDGATPVGIADYMIYLDEGIVRSIPLAGWPAQEIVLNQKEIDRQQGIATRQGLITAAQSAVGKLFKDLDAAARWALFVLVLWKLGALNRDGTIRELSEWL